MNFPKPFRLSQRFLFLWILGGLFVVSLRRNEAAQNPQTQNAKSSNPESRQLFESVCAACHGLDGHGGERGPDIATRQQIVQLPDAELLEILRRGKPAAGMPPFGAFGDEKLKGLLEYLRTLQGKGAAIVLPGDAHRGKVLFFGAARCSECHMVRGVGGFLGRDLSAYGATLSPADIRANILKPGSNLPNRATKYAVITLRDSQKLTGIIRNEDNFSIQLQSVDGTFHLLNRSEVAQMDFEPQPIMPADYGTTLKPADLDDLVSYLVTVAREGKTGKHEEGDEED
jgi:cytochrome c oxidase cbb3-type subunit III